MIDPAGHLRLADDLREAYERFVRRCDSLAEDYREQRALVEDEATVEAATDFLEAIHPAFNDLATAYAQAGKDSLARSQEHAA